MEGPGTRAERDERAMRWVLLALLLAGATNAVVAVVDGVLWAWWVAGLCLFGALLSGVAGGGEPAGAGPRAPVRHACGEADRRPVR
ncbi:hypothetical protein [Saccharothrix lopnurensis]|uniref:Uncharacterized protein n=1 Tax=Saccharothrix lopnurensis TaxID=1670621 RepID=A0ABW1PCH8_9PSEU